MFQQLFAPPTFPGDADQTRRAKTFHWIQWTLIVTLTVGMTALAVARPEIRLRTLMVMLVVNGMGGVWLYLVRRGRTRVASWGLILQSVALISALALSAGGPMAPATHANLIIVLAAGLLLGARAGTITAALCLAASLGLASLLDAGLISAPPTGQGAWTLWAVNAIMIAIVAGMQHLAANTIDASLAQAQAELPVRRETEAKLRRHKGHRSDLAEFADTSGAEDTGVRSRVMRLCGATDDADDQLGGGAYLGGRRISQQRQPVGVGLAAQRLDGARALPPAPSPLAGVPVEAKQVQEPLLHAFLHDKVGSQHAVHVLNHARCAVTPFHDLQDHV